MARGGPEIRSKNTKLPSSRSVSSPSGVSGLGVVSSSSGLGSAGLSKVTFSSLNYVWLVGLLVNYGGSLGIRTRRFVVCVCGIRVSHAKRDVTEEFRI